MDTVADLERNLSPVDDVDFTSGFETQYEQEYRPLKQEVIVPATQKEHTLWYRDLETSLVVLVLVVIVFVGSVMLSRIVFSSNFLYVGILLAIYAPLAVLQIIIEMKSVRLR